MIYKSGFFGLCCLCLAPGVLGDEVKSVSVMEGDSVTLYTNVTDIQKDDHIMWIYGSQATTIAQFFKQANLSFIYDDVNDGRFRAILQLNNQTGSLTITNVRLTHNGLYKLQIINSRGTSYKRFNVAVYAPLPIPVITRISVLKNCSSSSEISSVSNCSLLCSVLNVTDLRDVNLSWYQGNSLLSSISVSDLNIRLSLPLEVEYQDTNTYSCVVSNPIANQTKHLNITHLCQPCSGKWDISTSLRIGIIVGVVILVVAVAVFVALKYLRSATNKVEEVITNEDVLYSETTFCARGVKGPKADEEDHVVYSSVT
ncbi:CD48 antigen-like isoform X1 [Paramisgurnus dabryanus]|uniref:CD48 antigen-like isoform X1 n=1 Tax=Paramisgurnus dabryanus TaxID=90735 RepID=UPI0031F3513A